MTSPTSKAFQPIGDDLAASAITPMVSGKITNREKMEILDRYSVVFAEDNVFTYNILPILLSKPYLLSKIELFYDRQFEELLKKKTLAALDFPHIVHESMKSKFRESKNYFVQSLANIIYSGEKYSEENEVTLFLEFCLRKGENQKLLFYLFLRQHFKILTYTTFLSHNKTSSDPSKITITFDNACDIVAVAFSHEKIAQEKLMEAIKAKFTKGQKIAYYDFMVTLMNVRMIYSDLPMLDKAVALYRVTNFAELTDAFAQKNMIGIEQGKAAEHKVNAFIGTVDISANNQSRDLGSSAQINKGASKPRSDITTTINPKSRQFFEVVKAEIKPFCDKHINIYLEKEQIDGADIADQQPVVAQHLQKKLYFIVSSIFAEDRKRFLAILRTDIESNPGILDFWMDLQDSVKETQRMGLINSNVAQEFLKRIMQHALISKQMNFLMNYRLHNPEQMFDCNLYL